MKNLRFLPLSLSQDFNQVIQDSWEEIVRNHINRLISKIQLSDPTKTAASPKRPIPPGTYLSDPIRRPLAPCSLGSELIWWFCDWGRGARWGLRGHLGGSTRRVYDPSISFCNTKDLL